MSIVQLATTLQSQSQLQQPQQQLQQSQGKNDKENIQNNENNKPQISINTINNTPKQMSQNTTPRAQSQQTIILNRSSTRKLKENTLLRSQRLMDISMNISQQQQQQLLEKEEKERKKQLEKEKQKRKNQITLEQLKNQQHLHALYIQPDRIRRKSCQCTECGDFQPTFQSQVDFYLPQTIISQHLKDWEQTASNRKHDQKQNTFLNIKKIRKKLNKLDVNNDLEKSPLITSRLTLRLPLSQQQGYLRSSGHMTQKFNSSKYKVNQQQRSMQKTVLLQNTNNRSNSRNREGTQYSNKSTTAKYAKNLPRKSIDYGISNFGNLSTRQPRKSNIFFDTPKNRQSSSHLTFERKLQESESQSENQSDLQNNHKSSLENSQSQPMNSETQIDFNINLKSTNNLDEEDEEEEEDYEEEEDEPQTNSNNNISGSLIPSIKIIEDQDQKQQFKQDFKPLNQQLASICTSNETITQNKSSNNLNSSKANSMANSRKSLNIQLNRNNHSQQNQQKKPSSFQRVSKRTATTLGFDKEKFKPLSLQSSSQQNSSQQNLKSNIMEKSLHFKIQQKFQGIPQLSTLKEKISQQRTSNFDSRKPSIIVHQYNKQQSVISEDSSDTDYIGKQPSLKYIQTLKIPEENDQNADQTTIDNNNNTENNKNNKNTQKSNITSATKKSQQNQLESEEARKIVNEHKECERFIDNQFYKFYQISPRQKVKSQVQFLSNPHFIEEYNKTNKQQKNSLQLETNINSKPLIKLQSPKSARNLTPRSKYSSTNTTRTTNKINSNRYQQQQQQIDFTKPLNQQPELIQKYSTIITQSQLDKKFPSLTKPNLVLAQEEFYQNMNNKLQQFNINSPKSTSNNINNFALSTILTSPKSTTNLSSTNNNIGQNIRQYIDKEVSQQNSKYSNTYLKTKMPQTVRNQKSNYQNKPYFSSQNSINKVNHSKSTFSLSNNINNNTNNKLISTPGSNKQFYHRSVQSQDLSDVKQKLYQQYFTTNSNPNNHNNTNAGKIRQNSVHN